MYFYFSEQTSSVLPILSSLLGILIHLNKWNDSYVVINFDFTLMQKEVKKKGKESKGKKRRKKQICCNLCFDNASLRQKLQAVCANCL